MKILIILNDPPYGKERSYNGLRLADAVACAKHGQKVPQDFYNIELMLKPIIRNSKVLACGTCMDARDITYEEIFEGAERSTMPVLSENTLDADRVLVF